MILPKGVNSADFSSALAQWAKVVGSQWVFHSEEDLQLYRDPYSPLWGEAGERLASAAVAPDSVEQVQAIVQIANRYKIPLYAVSTGKNLGYGGAAPVHSGSVVVDLKRMNRIIEVDDKRHFAIVEPGVSFFDLYDHIQAHGLKVFISTPEPGWGSVQGNALDRGVGWTGGVYRDHFRSHCGLEVVLPNGELMRTGMGALPNANTFAQFKYGFGPEVNGLFAQGNFGIVTKMGLWLMPEPECYMTGKVQVFKQADLVPLIDTVTEMEHADLIGLPHYLSPLAFTFDPALLALTNRPGGPVAAEVDRYAADHQLPVWEATLQFYGPTETVEASWRYAQRKLRQVLPEARFEPGPQFHFPMSREDRDKVPFKISIGVPSLEGFSRSGARTRLYPNPSDGHMFFSPVIPKTGADAMKGIKLFAQLHADAGTAPGYNPWFFPPQAWVYRSLFMLAAFPTSRSDPAVNRRTRDAFMRAVDIAVREGWGEYRTPAIFADMISDTYSFNHHALRRFIETMKDAVDPNGILSPGRAGIWPKRLRKERQ